MAGTVNVLSSISVLQRTCLLGSVNMVQTHSFEEFLLVRISFKAVFKCQSFRHIKLMRSSEEKLILNLFICMVYADSLYHVIIA